MDETRPTDQHRERLDAVRVDPPLILAAAEDDVTAHVVECAARGDAGAKPSLEDALHCAEHRRPAALLRQVRRLGSRQRHALRCRRLLNSDDDIARVSRRRRPVHRLGERGQLAPSRIERARHEVEHWLDRRRGGIALLRELGVGFRNAKRERRNDVVRCHRTHFINRKVHRRRRRKEQIGEHRERQRQRNARSVKSEPRPARCGVRRVRSLCRLLEIHPAAFSASCRSYARTMSRTRRWRTTSPSSK